MAKGQVPRLAHSLRALIVPILILFSIALVGVITGALLRGRGDYTAVGIAPEDGVLHLRATRSGDVTGQSRTTQLEAWFDSATGEGKLVERAPDGSPLSIVAFAEGTLTTYLGDARHAVIRRNVKAGSGPSDRLRFELFRYAEAAKRGGGQIVGRGQIGATTTERIRIEVEGSPIVADIDPATGLTLHEEFGPIDDRTFVRDTTYELIEWVGRESLADDVWRVDLPPGTGVEEYNDGPSGRVDSTALGALPYAVYGLANEGQPRATFRRNSAMPGGPSSDAYYLIYQTPEGEVQCISSLPPDPAFSSGSKWMPRQRSGTAQIGETIWTIESSGRGVQGGAQIDGTLVTIVAPNQAILERVAGSLQRLDR